MGKAVISVPHESVVISIKEYNELKLELKICKEELKRFKKINYDKFDEFAKDIKNSNKTIIVINTNDYTRVSWNEYLYCLGREDSTSICKNVLNISDSFVEEVVDDIYNIIFEKLIEDKKLRYRIKEKIEEKIDDNETYEKIKDDIDSEISNYFYKSKDKCSYNITENVCNLIRNIFKKHNNE